MEDRRGRLAEHGIAPETERVARVRAEQVQRARQSRPDTSRIDKSVKTKGGGS